VIPFGNLPGEMTSTLAEAMNNAEHKHS
jgi:hypothetical protein